MISCPSAETNLLSDYKKNLNFLSFQMKVHKSQTMSNKSSIGRHYSSAGAWEQQMSSTNWPSNPNVMKPSRSDPSLAPSFSAVPTAAAVVVMALFLYIAVFVFT